MPTKPAAIESVAKVLVVDKQNRALVLTLGKHLLYPEKSFTPDLPGGIVDPGESEQQAAIREAQEECSIELDPAAIQLAYAQTAYSAKDNKTVSKLLYIARINDAPQITLSWEHSDYAWVPIDQLEDVAFSPSFAAAVRHCSSYDLV